MPRAPFILAFSCTACSNRQMYVKFVRKTGSARQIHRLFTCKMTRKRIVRYDLHTIHQGMMHPKARVQIKLWLLLFFNQHSLTLNELLTIDPRSMPSPKNRGEGRKPLIIAIYGLV